MNSEQAESTDALSLPEARRRENLVVEECVARVLGTEILGKFRCRLINANWGPRGFLHAFQRVRKLGASSALVLSGGVTRSGRVNVCRFFPRRRTCSSTAGRDVAPLSQLAANPRVQYWRGVLASSGENPFRVHGDQSSLLASQFSQAPATLVPARTLDSFLRNELDALPDPIKLDVQGVRARDPQRGRGVSAFHRVPPARTVVPADLRRGPLAHEVMPTWVSVGSASTTFARTHSETATESWPNPTSCSARETSRVFQSERWT